MILEVRNLTKTFRNGKNTQTAVDRVSFFLEERRCLGIIGESGSGKSTTVNMIAGFLNPDTGSIFYEGKELAGVRRRTGGQFRRTMQMVFQDPQASFDPGMKIGEGILEPLVCAGIRDDLDGRLSNALKMVDLKEEYSKKYPWQISGGECQRAAIARAIITEPHLLICDEVTSALDVSVQAQIIHLLYRLKEEMGMSMIFISHDLATVSSLCDHVAVMYKGKYLEYGPTMEIIRNPLHPYTEDLLRNAVRPGAEPAYERPERSGSNCVYAPCCRAWCKECSRMEATVPEEGKRFVLCSRKKERVPDEA